MVVTTSYGRYGTMPPYHTVQQSPVDVKSEGSHIQRLPIRTGRPLEIFTLINIHA